MAKASNTRKTVSAIEALRRRSVLGSMQGATPKIDKAWLIVIPILWAVIIAFLIASIVLVTKNEDVGPKVSAYTEANTKTEPCTACAL